MPRPRIDERFFDQPGFSELYDVWSDVFSAGDDFDAAQALGAVAKVRDDLVAGNVIRTADMNVLESVACRYARIMHETVQVELLEMDDLHV